MNDKAEVEQLKEQEDIRAALKQTPGTKESIPLPTPELKDKLWFGTYLLTLLVLLALYYLLGSNAIPARFQYVPLLRSLVLGVVFIVLTAAIAKSIHVYLINQIENKAARYNLRRVLNLLAFLAMIIIMLTVLSANCCLLYTSPSPRDRQKSRMPSSA